MVHWRMPVFPRPVVQIAVFDHVINLINLTICRQIQLSAFVHFDGPSSLEKFPAALLLLCKQITVVDSIDMGYVA